MYIIDTIIGTIHGFLVGGLYMLFRQIPFVNVTLAYVLIAAYYLIVATLLIKTYVKKEKNKRKVIFIVFLCVNLLGMVAYYFEGIKAIKEILS